MPIAPSFSMLDPGSVVQVAAQFLTAAVFFGIAFSLVFTSYLGRANGFKYFLNLIAAFAIFCGLNAVFDVFNAWYDLHFLLGLTRIAAGVVSILIVMNLWHLLPKLKTLPSRSEMERHVTAIKQESKRQLGINTALVEKIAKRTRELEELASTDALTNLLNRRAILQIMDVELERADRLNSQLSVLMLDLDHFKAINDTYGHQMGDTVLVKAADILMESSRKTDFIGRIGGEEFVAIFPNTDYANAKQLAERYRKNIEDAQLNEIRFTCSIGLAQREKDESRDNLLLRADRALYQSKNSGRNKIS